MHKDAKAEVLMICVGFSPYSSLCPSTPVVPAFYTLLFPERTLLLTRKFVFFTIFPITPLRTNLKGWLCLSFVARCGVGYPGEMQSSQEQDQDRRHSCDNHIMSCKMRIFNETPLSAVRIKVCHPPEQAETFQTDWAIFAEAGSPLILPGPLTPKNSSWL